MNKPDSLNLSQVNKMFIRQVFELAEWIGFETRNKYEILDEHKRPLAYAAEQQKGFLSFLFRQNLGHWRTFDIHFFTPNRELFMVAHHPFRWFFKRIEVKTGYGHVIGAIQKQFSILTKKFAIEDQSGRVVMTVSSPIWKFWTFTFIRNGKTVAEIKKKWAGLLAEAYTDKDNFMLDIQDYSLTDEDRKVLLAASIFIDLAYFEKKD